PIAFNLVQCHFVVGPSCPIFESFIIRSVLVVHLDNVHAQCNTMATQDWIHAMGTIRIKRQDPHLVIVFSRLLLLGWESTFFFGILVPWTTNHKMAPLILIGQFYD